VVSDIGVVAPYWLDRPDNEVVGIALEAERTGFGTMWLGEMATYDVFSLATAVGLRTERIGLRIGPLPISVRTPVSVAMGVSSVSDLARPVAGVGLGGSSPFIVSGWHDREWTHAAGRMREAVGLLRSMLAGDRADFAGEHIRSKGFRLRKPLPGLPITVAAFGPAMTRVAAEVADEVVLNLVSPEHVASVRKTVDALAAGIGRTPPRLAVWIPAAIDPGTVALQQAAAQTAVYLSPPGYGEMFAALGYSSLVERARAGEPRKSLATDIPTSLIAAVGAVGSRADVLSRIAEFQAAGADHVGIVPSTAEDPCGARLLAEVGRR
jgi:probable F420-dependent oxidoreductase